jgi:hypothetical protein
MLLNFKIKNFRSIKNEIVLDLQATSDKTMVTEATFGQEKVLLLKSAAIYGPNASGKSNIMKAFVVFRSMILESLLRSNLTVDLPNEFFKLNAETENKPSFFEMTFLLDGDIFTYGFEINKKRVCGEWLKQKKGNITLFERNNQKIQSNKNYFKEATKILKDQTLERVLFLSVLASNKKPISRKIIEFIQKTNFIPGTNRGSTLNYTFGQFTGSAERADKIKEFMRFIGVEDIKADEKMISAEQIKNIPDKFKDLLFKENSQVAQRSLKFLYKKYNMDGEKIGNELLDFFAEESEGTQQMFALSAPIIDTLEKGNILFIDEIDASLHPILCQYLISIFNSKEKNPNNAQLIFTTHDISLLDENFLRRDQIYFTDKDKKGATALFSLADISERKGVNFAKRYLEGRYNALPYIKDFEDLKFNK